VKPSQSGSYRVGLRWPVKPHMMAAVSARFCLGRLTGFPDTSSESASAARHAAVSSGSPI